MSSAFDAFSAAVVLVPLVVLWAAALIHIFTRRPDLSLPWKIIWSVVVLVLPYVGVLIYALLRPPVRPDRQVNRAGDPTSVSLALDRLRALAEEHDGGMIDDVAYEAAKREVFGLADGAG